MIVDIYGNLLGSLELVYEQCRPEVRGLWREHIDPYLRIHTETVPESGDWVRPWLALEVSPTPYLDQHQRFPRHHVTSAREPGMLHDRADLRIAAMNAAEVDIVVLHPASFAGPAAALADINLACGLLSGYNRYLGTYCHADPDRLQGAIQLHGLHLDWSLHEIRRLADRPWVAGASIQLPSDISHWDSRLDSVWAALAEADLPLFHRTELYDSPKFPGHADLWNDPLLARTLGPAWDAQRYLTEYVLGTVPYRHPQLRVCVLDGGVGWIPAWLEALGDIDPTAGRTAAALFREGRIGVTIAPYESEQTVTGVIDAVGDRCLMWGSSYPRHNDQGPTRLQTRQTLSDRSRRLLLGSNALRLLGQTARISSPDRKEMMS